MFSAAGDRLLDPDGNQILDDDGNVQLSDGAGDDCCCGASICGGCTGTPPDPMTLAFTGLTWSTCTLGSSYHNAFPGGGSIEIIGDLNTTFTIPFIPDVAFPARCVWQDLDLSVGVTVHHWSAAGCTGTSFGNQKIFSTVSLYAGFMLVSFSFGASPGSSSNGNFFHATLPDAQPCVGPYTVNNDYTSIGASGGALRNIAYGGSVTITG